MVEIEKDALLRVRHLTISAVFRKGTVPIVHDVTFDVPKGKILGIVGESGCGKSVTSLSILKLLEKNLRIEPESEILLEGRDLTKLSARDMADVRGKDISMIFQDPMTSLNPVKVVGDQIAEAVRIHTGLSDKEADKAALEMIRKVGIPAAEKRFHEYPHQLSGGMKQRVMIAMALICRPKLLIADEPTTALDVTTQAQILSLIRGLNEDLGTSVILITHDMGVVASMADYVAVMYAGRILEYNNVYDIFKNPRHPYTKMLLQSIPRLDRDEKVLPTIPGTVPSPSNMPPGCKFYPRCPWAFERCRGEEPELAPCGQGFCRCFREGGE